MSSGTRSRRVERIWPNLTEIGPRVSSARRSRRARVLSGRASSSCSLKRRPTAMMRSSRASLAKPLETLVEPCDAVAQLRDRFAERIELDAPSEHALLVDQVVADGTGHALERVEVPSDERAARGSQAVGGDVAQHT